MLSGWYPELTHLAVGVAGLELNKSLGDYAPHVRNFRLIEVTSQLHFFCALKGQKFCPGCCAGRIPSKSLFG